MTTTPTPQAGALLVAGVRVLLEKAEADLAFCRSTANTFDGKSVAAANHESYANALRSLLRQVDASSPAAPPLDDGWREDVDEQPAVPTEATPIISSPDSLDDGRCVASSWRGKVPTQRPTYESWFGPAGYNRCIGSAGHVNRLHKDEWGYVFSLADDRTEFRVVRHEPRLSGPSADQLVADLSKEGVR